MNRRQFLTATAAAVATLATPRPLRAAESRRRLKAGFLGGAHSHAPEKWRLVRASPDYELVGMAEDSPAVRAQFERQGARFLTPEALITASDVVFVESAVADHARHARQVLAAGKHTHVEKPPADNLADVEEMVRRARQHHVLMQVGYMWRYHPGFAAIFEAVQRGWLGEVYLVRGMIGNQLAADRRPEWAQFRGGGLFELGSHLIDALIRLLGEPVSVTPFLRQHGDFSDNLKDHNVAVFDFPRATGVIHNSTLQTNASRQRAFEVFGTQGSAMLRPIEPPALEIELARAAGPYSAGAQTVPMPKYDRYVGDLVELAAAIRGERALSVTLDEELRVQRWLLKACGMM